VPVGALWLAMTTASGLMFGRRILVYRHLEKICRFEIFSRPAVTVVERDAEKVSDLEVTAVLDLPLVSSFWMIEINLGFLWYCAIQSDARSALGNIVKDRHIASAFAGLIRPANRDEVRAHVAAGLSSIVHTVLIGNQAVQSLACVVKPDSR
jgi:hypothetical protein